nr:MAG TPA: hypothetical protein [Bacteriophage sp.]
MLHLFYLLSNIRTSFYSYTIICNCKIFRQCCKYFLLFVS